MPFFFFSDNHKSSNKANVIRGDNYISLVEEFFNQSFLDIIIIVLLNSATACLCLNTRKHTRDHGSIVFKIKSLTLVKYDFFFMLKISKFPWGVQKYKNLLIIIFSSSQYPNEFTVTFEIEIQH